MLGSRRPSPGRSSSPKADRGQSRPFENTMLVMYLRSGWQGFKKGFAFGHVLSFQTGTRLSLRLTCNYCSADHARPYDASMIFLQQFVHACLAVARNAATDAGHWTPDAQKSGTPVMHASAHKHTSCCCMSYWVAMNWGASRCVVVDRFQMPLCSAGEESFCAMTTSSRGLLPQSWQSHHII